MAGGFVYTEDTERRVRLQKLLIDEGTAALRKIFDREVQHVNPQGLKDLLVKEETRGRLKGLYDDQKKILYPSGMAATEAANSSEDFDITLLCDLLRTLCDIEAPKDWGKPPKPPAGDTRELAWIMRLQLFRNEFYAHIPRTDLSQQEFDHQWAELSEIVEKLGGDSNTISQMKTKPITRDQVQKDIKKFEEIHRQGLIYQAITDVVNAKGEEVKEDMKENIQGVHDKLDSMNTTLEGLSISSKDKNQNQAGTNQSPQPYRPFVLLLKSKRVKKCQGCKKEFNDPKTPENVVIQHEDNYPYYNKPLKKMVDNFRYGYYHANLSCIKPKYEDFDPNKVVVPPDTKKDLTEDHIEYCHRHLGITLAHFSAEAASPPAGTPPAGAPPAAASPAPIYTYQCECGKTCRSKGGLTNHQKTCIHHNSLHNLHS